MLIKPIRRINLIIIHVICTLAGRSPRSGTEGDLAADPAQEAGLGVHVGLGRDEPGGDQGSRIDTLSYGSFSGRMVVRLRERRVTGR